MSELDGPVHLSRAELGFLRFAASMTAEPESPLAELPVPTRADETRAGRESLIDRSLVDARTLRPDRELVRRLLVVSEPDARLRLLARGQAGETVLVDAFERAGANVRVELNADGLTLSAAQDGGALRDELRRRLPVRGSAGDFVALSLDAEAYLAFTLLAARAVHPRLRRDSEALLSARLGRGLQRLVDDNLAYERDGAVSLRPFLNDLAQALADRRRLLLIRTDFGVHEWLTRDVSFVAVPGSLFQLYGTEDRGVMIAELDAAELERALEETVEAPLAPEERDLTA